MAFKLYIPNQLGGWFTFQAKTYQVANHEIEVDDLHTANYLVEHFGCTLYGGDSIKLAKSILVKRGRGLGDILMMTPVLRKLRKENPNAKITYACDLIFLDVLKYLPYIDRIVTIPQLGYHQNTSWVMESDGSKTPHDYWVNCDGIAENMDNQKDIATLHRIDIFGKVAGLSFTPEERRLDYVIDEEEAEWADKKWESLNLNKDDKVLAMALRATCYNRTMPLEKFQKISRLATSQGWKVILFDHDRLFGWEGHNIINLTGQTSVRQMAALMAKCNMFFGPDTGAWHLACALNVPNVVYFGAMNWKLRVTMPRTKVIVKNVTCYPCDRYDCHWHTKLACIDISPEVCWEEIEKFHNKLQHNYQPSEKELLSVH